VIHFWVPAATADPADLREWDPDLEPRRYANGVGHNVLELYVRLARRGVEVTAGEEIPRRARLVVVFSKSVYRPPRLRALLREAQGADSGFAVIRSDAPLSWSFPVRPVVEFMPTQATVRRPWQQWLPPLLQRGLVRRRDDRRGRIRSVAFKGSAGNIHPVLESVEWVEGLASRGLEWRVDAPRLGDCSDQSWHDFETIDAVLCTRGARTPAIHRKPPTRLINAWAAGCVPLADPDPSYLELATDGDDVFFVESPLAGLEVIDRLNADEQLLSRVERRIDDRAAEFSASAIVDQWRDALVGAAETAPGRRRARAARVAVARVTVTGSQLLDPVARPSRRGIAVARVRALRWKQRLWRDDPGGRASESSSETG
jgi:Glycosyl transferases group 1